MRLHTPISWTSSVIAFVVVCATVFGTVVLPSPQAAAASDGALDTTFHTTGIVTTAIGSGADVAAGVAIQLDGKIVVAGSSNNGSNDDFAVVRALSNGRVEYQFLFNITMIIRSN